MSVVRRLGGIEFNGALDADGTRWTCEELVGWYDGPTMRQQSIDMAGQWGTVLTENLYGPRHLVLHGKAKPGPGIDTSDLADKLNNITDVTHGWKTLYVDEAVPKQIDVKRNGEQRFRLADNQERVVEYEIPLIAPDPRKYGQTLKSDTVVVAAGTDGSGTNSTMTVVNVGNTQAYPEKIRVWGNGQPQLILKRIDTNQSILLDTGPVLTNEYLLFPNPLGAGRRVFWGTPTTPGETAGMTSHYDYVGTGTQWWMLKADGVGTEVKLQRSNAPASELKMTVWFRDTWI